MKPATQIQPENSVSSVKNQRPTCLFRKATRLTSLLAKARRLEPGMKVMENTRIEGASLVLATMGVPEHDLPVPLGVDQLPAAKVANSTLISTTFFLTDWSLSS
jgi:hypothetical protein